ncbi:MAG: SRPBCC family protein [Rhabdochlamydiaceae bacterium]|jgi:hypothetical protein
MFKWFYEYSTEVDIPLQKVWDFCINPNHWPQWMDQLESCKMEGEFKAGSMVKAKIKNRTFHLPIFITDVKPFKSCALLMKGPLISQTSSCTLREISRDKTALIMKTSIVSILTPFIKRYFTKHMEAQMQKCRKAILDNAKQNAPSDFRPGEFASICVIDKS